MRQSLRSICAMAAAVAAAPTIASSDSMEDAKAFIEQHREMPVFEAPGEPFDATSCMNGKKVMSIPMTMTIPFEVQLQNGMAAAAKEVGFTFETWDNQLKSDQWIQGISQAVSQGYDVIDLAGGINPAWLGPQLAEARGAGLKLSATHLYDVSQSPSDSVDYAANLNYSIAGKLLASWAYVETGGKPNVLIIGSKEVHSSPPYVKSIEDELEALCPDCKHQYLDIPSSDWATKIQSGTQAAMLTNPNINYIIPIYDVMAQFVLPALRITGSTDAVKIASFNGTPFVLDMLRQGDVEMIIGESLEWAGYAAVDNIMRMVCDKPSVDSLNVPFLIFDQGNVETAGVPAAYDKGYGEDYLDGFRQLWQLK